MTANRTILPQRRQCETFELQHAGRRFQISFGSFPDGRIGEIFINGTKAGSDLEALARDGCVLLSIALQYGVPLSVLAGAITRGWQNEPQSIIGVVLDELANSRNPA